MWMMMMLWCGIVHASNLAEMCHQGALDACAELTPATQYDHTDAMRAECEASGDAASCRVAFHLEPVGRGKDALSLFSCATDHAPACTHRDVRWPLPAGVHFVTVLPDEPFMGRLHLSPEGEVKGSPATMDVPEGTPCNRSSYATFRQPYVLVSNQSGSVQVCRVQDDTFELTWSMQTQPPLHLTLAHSGRVLNYRPLQLLSEEGDLTPPTWPPVSATEAMFADDAGNYAVAAGSGLTWLLGPDAATLLDYPFKTVTGAALGGGRLLVSGFGRVFVFDPNTGARLAEFEMATAAMTVADTGDRAAVKLFWGPTVVLGFDELHATPSSTPLPSATTTPPYDRLDTDRSSPTLGALKWVPPGTFVMGSPEHEADRDDDEDPHTVTLTHGFWMMQQEVTLAMWKAVMGDETGHSTGYSPDFPMGEVTWSQAVRFATRVSELEGVEYRLPTEAEWEYAARGGDPFLYAGGDDIVHVGWVEQRDGPRPHRGCGLVRNGYGLCDMSGNRAEWTADWYGPYPKGSVVNPSGPETGTQRVIRGGTSLFLGEYARVADRQSEDPDRSALWAGFRLVRVTPP